MNWITRLLGRRSRPAVMSSRPTARLRVEELESRWVPSALHSTSTNWAGYAVASTPGTVTSVSGTFTVPTVTGTGTAYSSAWVGIDGYNSSTVEQTGIEADVVRGVAQYSAWYEMYPAYPVTIPLAVHPGDTISASVAYNNGQFTLTLTDANDPAGHNSFSVTQTLANAQLSSAEWIAEAPSSNTGVLPLANFSTATFTNSQATINGATGPINNSTWAGVTVNQINMVSKSGTLEAGTSALNSSGLGFTVTYGSVGTPPADPLTPPVTPPTPPPAPTGTISTTTTLVGVVNRRSWVPSVTLTATVSPSVPVGSKVELLYGNQVLATGTVQMVNGVEQVSFVVSFRGPGSYSFTAQFLGSGAYAASTSNTVTVTVH